MGQVVIRRVTERRDSRQVTFALTSKHVALSNTPSFTLEFVHTKTQIMLSSAMAAQSAVG